MQSKIPYTPFWVYGAIVPFVVAQSHSCALIFGGSTISEFHTALGQFINYRLFLRISDSTRSLYLAVPSETYEEFFKGKIISQIIRENNLKIIVYEPISEVIEQWIN